MRQPICPKCQNTESFTTDVRSTARLERGSADTGKGLQLNEEPSAELDFDGTSITICDVCEYTDQYAAFDAQADAVYSVTMMPPDYESDPGEDFRTLCVVAASPEDAVRQARDTLEKSPDFEADRMDFRLVTVFSGQPDLVRCHLDNL